MLPIAHFAIGVIGGTLLLMFFPQLFGDIIKNDIFIIFLSGLWAMIPDIPALVGNTKLDDKPIMNIFWFHQYFDKKFKNDFNFRITAIIIGIAIIILYFYSIL